MELKELKKPYSEILKYNAIDLNKIDSIDICNKYFDAKTEKEKNLYTSILVCLAWPSLTRIYYKPCGYRLSAEDCYDIFMESFSYIMSKHVWTDENSSLYKDKDAFKKAMNICIESRRKNFLNALFKDKRIANSTSASLDDMEEDFQEGFFSFHEDTYDLYHEPLKEQTIYLFKHKNYLSAIILDAILNYNIFSDIDGTLDYRKLRKYLNQFDEFNCKRFSDIYNLSEDEVKNSLKYFKNLSVGKLTEKIDQSLIILRNDNIINKVIKC